MGGFAGTALGIDFGGAGALAERDLAGGSLMRWVPYSFHRLAARRMFSKKSARSGFLRKKVLGG